MILTRNIMNCYVILVNRSGALSGAAWVDINDSYISTFPTMKVCMNSLNEHPTLLSILYVVLLKPGWMVHFSISPLDLFAFSLVTTIVFCGACALVCYLLSKLTFCQVPRSADHFLMSSLHGIDGSWSLGFSLSIWLKIMCSPPHFANYECNMWLLLSLSSKPVHCIMIFCA